MSLAVMVAIGINILAYRKALGFSVIEIKAEGLWREFLSLLNEHALTGSMLVISDLCLGMKPQIDR
ncbi:transposase [Synechococcus sp. MIT S9508]|uniref:transposase n=1 Tax=Synechococcus sp. MIT S9508 TaxID=1801629 RepID=UPI0012E76C40|nr:transposase [Synechococcus sp. MIT S9508]